MSPEGFIRIVGLLILSLHKGNIEDKKISINLTGIKKSFLYFFSFLLFLKLPPQFPFPLYLKLKFHDYIHLYNQQNYRRLKKVRDLVLFDYF